MTTKEEISDWFDRGVKDGAKFMLVICDSFDHSDYPDYFEDAEAAWKTWKSPGEMQRCMEAYDLTANKSEQLAVSRVMRLPALTPPIRSDSIERNEQ